MSGDKQSLNHETALNTPEQNEFTSPYPVFDDSGGSDDDDSFDEFNDTKFVIKPSKSFTNLLNSTTSSISFSVSTNSSSIGSVSSLEQPPVDDQSLQELPSSSSFPTTSTTVVGVIKCDETHQPPLSSLEEQPVALKENMQVEKAMLLNPATSRPKIMSI